MMKKIALTALISLFVFTAIPGFSQDVLDQPLAIVKLYKTEVISVSKFQRTLEIFESDTGQTFGPEEKRYLLDNMIYEILILQAAENEGIDISEDTVIQTAMNNLMAQTGMAVTREQYRQMVEQQGIPFDQYIDYARRQMIVETYVAQKKRANFENAAEPTEQEIQLFFNNNSQDFINPTLIRVSHIFFPTHNVDAAELPSVQASAEAAYQKILSGMSFESVMETVPLDPNSVIQHGDLGYAARGNQEVNMIFGENFMNRIFELNVGDIALLQSRVGYHVVKITDYRERTFLELDDKVSPVEDITVRDYIYNILLQNKMQMIFQQSYQEVIDELTEASEIQIFEDNL